MKLRRTGVRRRYFLLGPVLWLTLFVLTSCGNNDSAQTDDEGAWSEADQPATTQAKPDTTDTAPTEPPPEAVVATPNTNFTRKPQKTGYISAICLNVRSEAGTGSEIVGHLFKGDRIDIYETKGRWHLMVDETGYQNGWVSAAYTSSTPVKNEFPIPEDYKEPRTPTVIEGITAKYVGTVACQGCHSRPHGEFTMGEYGVWRDHYHADAYRTLSKSYAKEFARRRGIGDPAKDWRCVKCHVTAYGVPAERLGPHYSHEEGVACEACHGPASEYLIPHQRSGYDRDKLAAMGFRRYTSLEERDQMCRSCHNSLSPTFIGFRVTDFSKAIRHWSSEYTIVVNDPQQEPVIQARSPVPTSVETEDLTVPPPVSVPEPAVTDTIPNPDTKTASSGDDRLDGVDAEWTLDLDGRKGPVHFPHFAHNDYVSTEGEGEVCQVCHHQSKAGATPGNCTDGACHKFQSTDVVKREKAFHGNCKVCHREEQAGPRKCSECHDKTRVATSR